MPDRAAAATLVAALEAQAEGYRTWCGLCADQLAALAGDPEDAEALARWERLVHDAEPIAWRLEAEAIRLAGALGPVREGLWQGPHADAVRTAADRCRAAAEAARRATDDVTTALQRRQDAVAAVLDAREPAAQHPYAAALGSGPVLLDASG